MNILPVFDFKNFSGLVFAALLSGCAGIPDNLATNGTLEVDRIDSRNAYIGHVYVRPVDSELKISGSIRKRFHGRSPIPGHLHIDGHRPQQRSADSDNQSLPSRRWKITTVLFFRNFTRTAKHSYKSTLGPSRKLR